MKINIKQIVTAGLFFSIVSIKAQFNWNSAGNTPGASDFIGSTNAADLYIKTTGTERIRVTSTGSIGIGNIAPQHFVDVKVPAVSGGESILNLAVSDAGGDFFRVCNGASANLGFMPSIVGMKASSLPSNAAALYLCGSTTTGVDNNYAINTGEPLMNFNVRRDYGGTGGGSAVVNRPLFTWSNFTTKYMTMLANGFLGLNTTAPTANLTVNGKVLFGDPSLSGFVGVNTSGQYLLYVQQGILTEKVKVAIATSSNWADHVFEKSYKLRGLNELEKYILDNKHLPNIPSAEEVVKEGVDLAIMNARLLEKVEELSLYIIEMNKRLEKIEKK